MKSRRQVLVSLTSFAAAATMALPVAPDRASAEPPADQMWAARLLAAAQSQVGVTVLYDPAYVRLTYPGGDVPRERGVCTDVIVRAYRDAFAVDLQKLVHEDMRKVFSAYPKRWGLAKPDTSIDHRRVGNLATYFARHGEKLRHDAPLEEFAVGDLVTQMVLARLPHIGIVTDKRDAASNRPLVVHNIGMGTRVDDVLAAHPVTGRYRFKPV